MHPALVLPNLAGVNCSMNSRIPDLTLRQETLQDKAFLESLYRSTRDDLLQLGLPGAMLDNMMAMQFHAQQSGYRKQYPDAVYDIIEKDGEPAGCLITHRGIDAIRLVYIALLPHERNRGHGRRLIRALQAEAAGANKTLRLSVSAQNTQAQRLYASSGFQVESNDGVYLEMNWSAGSNLSEFSGAQR